MDGQLDKTLQVQWQLFDEALDIFSHLIFPKLKLNVSLYLSVERRLHVELFSHLI